MLLYCTYTMSLIDLLFPRFCLGCSLPGAYICPSCFKKLQMVKKTRCLYCQRESYLGLTHPACLQKLYIDGNLSIFHYDRLMRKIIKNIKYRLAVSIFKELVNNIGPQYLDRLFTSKKLFNGASIQSIPLTRQKLNSRGFNQADLVATFLNSILGLKTGNFLIRVKETLPQANLSSSLKRYQNIRGVFKLKQGAKIKNKKIILVDDVITSGATMREAARILKRAGAAKVYVFSLARG